MLNPMEMVNRESNLEKEKVDGGIESRDENKGDENRGKSMDFFLI
jgi:hypothetical protein